MKSAAFPTKMYSNVKLKQCSDENGVILTMFIILVGKAATSCCYEYHCVLKPK